MARITCLTYFVLAALCAAAGCGGAQKADPDVTISWQVRPDPPTTGPATVTVTMADSAGTPVQDAEVVIEGLMTHPGMSPVLADAREAVPGRYVADLNFTMRGDWILVLEATLADGRMIHEQKELPGVGAR